MAADWIGINSSHYHSHCGDEGGDWTIARALNGLARWCHYVEHVHFVILDLGQRYNITKVRGRSYWGYDPTNVNIYVNDTGEAPWGAAVASGINTWQDTDDWVEVDTTDKEGRFVLVEIVDTEAVDNHLTFGDDPAWPILDVYGELAVTIVEPATQALALTLHAPSLSISSIVTPSTLELALAQYAPSVVFDCTVTPDTLALALALNAPEVAIRFTDIPPFMHKDLIDPYSGGAWLWLVEIAVPGQSTKRIARNTEDVRYGEKDFDKFNLQIGEQIFSGGGSIPRVTLRVFQDVNRIIEDMVNETEGALGAGMKLIRVNEKYLETPVTALEADYDNLASESDSEWVTFTLGMPNPLTQRFPLRIYSSSMCPEATPKLFKGPACQLPLEHEDTSCTGTYEDCFAKGNAAHWGGELGLNPNVVRV